MSQTHAPVERSALHALESSRQIDLRKTPAITERALPNFPQLASLLEHDLSQVRAIAERIFLNFRNVLWDRHPLYSGVAKTPCPKRVQRAPEREYHTSQLPAARESVISEHPQRRGEHDLFYMCVTEDSVIICVFLASAPSDSAQPFVQDRRFQGRVSESLI